MTNERGKVLITEILDKIDNYMYYPILIIVMAIAGLYFTIFTRGIQIRLFTESVRLLKEPPEDKQSVSSLQAMLVSTASRVGTGNVVGVSTAICLGGPGACFWMWLMCIIGASSAFIESTLAQIYKKKNDEGESFGGPAYYIEKALHAPVLAAVFCVFLITTYAVGFNLLCSYNLQSSFAAYSFYDTKTTPIIVGAVLAGLTAYCLLGGGKRIVRLTSILVPFMGIAYIGISLLVILMNAAWAMADITMGGMTLINLPCCMLLGKVAINALKDYEAQKKDGKNPVFLWKEHRSFG